MDSLVLIGIGLGIAVLLLIIGFVFSARSEGDSIVDERLEGYLEEELDEETGERTSFITEWLNSRVQGSSFGDRVKKELARADIKLKPGEYLILQWLSAAGLGLLAAFILGRGDPIFLWVFGALGAIFGFFIPRLYVRRQQNSRLQAFNDQLPDMLNLMVNGIRAGYSQMQAMEAVSKELPPPISMEFHRVVREMQIGIPLEQALDNLLRRIPSDDLDLIITAINIQREVGGNLAEILEIISYTIRERIRIQREIRVLVAQVLYSGRILSLMPIVLAMFLWGANRSYMMNFFDPQTRLCGIPLLICGSLMIGAGYVAMNRVADIEV
jgi:tight adherence protein B